MNFTNYKRYDDLLTEKIVKMLFPAYADDWQYLREGISIYVFPQTWGSTTCGADGIGGAAMTTALTTVFLSDNHDKAVVFINDRFRYSVNSCSKKFFEDLARFSMSGTKSSKYEKIDLE